MGAVKHLHLSNAQRQPLLKTSQHAEDTVALPAKGIHTHPWGSNNDEDAGIFFIGTATTVIE